MKVLKMEVGMLGTNCYIAVNEATGHGVVVDQLIISLLIFFKLTHNKDISV